MAVYIDNRGRFYIEFQYKGHRHKERLPEGTTRKDAEKLEVKLKNDLMFQSHGVETKIAAVTFERFVAETYGHVADRFDPARRTRSILLVKAALPFLKGKLMRSIKAADIENFKASRIALPTQHGTKRKPATVEREMSILSSIFTMAVDNDIIDYNPCSRVKKLSFDNVQDKLLRREDEERFFSHIHSEWTRDVCKMVLNTGLRQKDLMTLTRFQVRLQDNLIALTQGKTTRRVYITLNDVSYEILERRLKKRGDLLFASPKTKTANGSVRHSMLRACVKAGIEPLTIRDLRRTFGTRVVENGAADITASRMLGHAGTRMIPRYVRSLELMREAANLLTVSPTIPPGTENENVKLLKRKG